MLLARATNASLASPAAAIPDRSPLMSAAKTATPARESSSARTCSVTVLPVPVAPATRPCRFASASVRYSPLLPLPTKFLPSCSLLAIVAAPVFFQAPVYPAIDVAVRRDAAPGRCPCRSRRHCSGRRAAIAFGRGQRATGTDVRSRSAAGAAGGG